MLFQLYNTSLDGRSTAHLRHHPLQQTRGLYFSGLRLRRLSMDVMQKVWICQSLSWRGGNGGRWSIAHESILTLCVFVESTYLANLMLQMMMAYNDGDIISKIKFGILSHDDSEVDSPACTMRTTIVFSWCT
jgi:hypothetical protein